MLEKSRIAIHKHSITWLWLVATDTDMCDFCNYGGALRPARQSWLWPPIQRNITFLDLNCCRTSLRWHSAVFSGLCLRGSWRNISHWKLFKLRSKRFATSIPMGQRYSSIHRSKKDVNYREQQCQVQNKVLFERRLPLSCEATFGRFELRTCFSHTLQLRSW